MKNEQAGRPRNAPPEVKSNTTPRKTPNKRLSIMDVMALARGDDIMPPMFQERLNEFNADMLEENRMLNSEINAVRLNMEHQSVIAKKLMNEFKGGQKALQQQIEEFDEMIHSRQDLNEND